MIELGLMTACFMGIVGATCRFLKLDFRYAPLFSISLIGILLFGFSLAGFLKTGTFLIAGAGGVFAVYFTAVGVKNRDTISLTPGAVFAGLIVLSFFLSLKMTFTVVDDFVFWGIVGKYLVLFDHLPNADTTIIPKHLMYTPGTSLVHYFFHGLTGMYKPSLAYFAQNMILISALFVVIKKPRMERSVIRLCLAIVLLIIFCGSIFTKLQVDYLLTTLFFAILWIYYTGDELFLKLVAISAPICFLFLIKQIGFMLGLLLLVIIFFDLLFHGDFRKDRKFKALALVMLIAGGLLFLNRLWAWHCVEMGFTGFSNAITLETIMESFKIFSKGPVQNGFLIYVKAIFFGSADRLNLPYLFWYLLSGVLWTRIFKGMTPKERSRQGLLIKIMAGAYILYLVMNYFFQVIVFKVGANFDHIVGLTRYLNILFAQMVIFTLLMSVGRLWFKKVIPPKAVLTGAMAVMLILGISRIEKLLHPDKHDLDARHLAQKITMNTDRNRQNFIGVIPGMNDQFLGIKLLYHLLPDRVNYSPFPLSDQDGFMEGLAQYDYVLFYRSDEKVSAWAEELSGIPLETPGFFQIMHREFPASDTQKSATLKKVF
ncbi:MAG: hypothetical protein KJ658_03225 [Proteobacteria bacterium]|nr:hypothetical protein [Desulfobacula sp.]MBU3951124.1 hypothetical protein [Pseudomonadota bacterium]